MLDFVLFAVSALLALLILMIVYLLSKGKATSSSSMLSSSLSPSQAKKVPNWDRQPTDKQLGDLGLLSKHGSLHEYLLHIHDHGRTPISVFWWGPQRVVSVCSPDLFKDTMKLTNRPKQLFDLFEPLITSHSIQYANGLDWEERRKFLYPTLRDEFLREYIPCFIQIANETGTAWSQLSPDTEIELQEEFMTMAIKGVTRTCFGETFNSEKELRKMAKMYHTVWDEMEQRLHIGPPEPGSEREKTFTESIELMKNSVMSVVQARRDGTDTNEIPFIDALLQSGVSDPQIFADSLSFMVAGFHTSGYLLTWAIHYMTLHSEVMEKLVQEMKKEVGSDRGDKLIQYVQSTNTYLRKILDESLRVSTLAPYAARFADHDIVIGGYNIPAGTPIVIALGVALKNECIWKNVDKFDPEHFGSCTLQGKETLLFSPFGMGRRKCPGYAFSYVEVGIFLTILLQQFTLKPVGGVVKPIGMIHGLVSSPSEPLQYTVHPIA